MNPGLWLLDAIVSAAVAYIVTIALTRWGKLRYLGTAGVFAFVFIVFAYFASPYVQDVFRAWFLSSPTDRRCFFNAQIRTPEGADSETGASAKRYEFPLDTKVSWEPNDCVMVVQAYQKNSLLAEELEGQDSEEATIRAASEGQTGVIEIKIFREGFKTASSNVWINARP